MDIAEKIPISARVVLGEIQNLGRAALVDGSECRGHSYDCVSEVWATNGIAPQKPREKFEIPLKNMGFSRVIEWVSLILTPWLVRPVGFILGCNKP